MQSRAYLCVGGNARCVQLGVATGKVQARAPGRRRGIPQRRKGHHICLELAQHGGQVGIAKAESLVPGQADAQGALATPRG